MNPTESARESTPSRSGRLLILGGIALVVVAMIGYLMSDWYRTLPEDTVATYVGRNSCIRCHQQEADLFHGSHHDLAMDRANSQTVLGDFDDVEFEHYGIKSRLYRNGEKYMVNTEGPDGQMQDFEVKYVFGVDPLQQYMVEFDRTADMADNEIGRVQVLRISWDTQKKEWFYLSPPDVDEKLSPDDDLHWTGIAQRWNTMCADCHSTNLHKNFDSNSNKYRTTFSEIDVSCEACHGPGSTHVKLAEANSFFWDRKHGKGLTPLKLMKSQQEVQNCAPCHSRRSVIHPNFRPDHSFHDNYVTELLNPQTYFADGQILDEVYVLGSFMQSKMYHKDIRCTDCHDPHTARLKHSGNQVCVSCHEHSAGKYDTPAHHYHKDGSPGASCVECHMPETTYMEVDPRRDHSLRVPRPDLSVSLGTPNACTRCHLDRVKIPDEKRKQYDQYLDWVLAARDGDQEVASALNEVDRWAAEAVERWFPDTERPQTTAPLLSRARDRDNSVLNELLKAAANRLEPGMVRATALQDAMGLFEGHRDEDRKLVAAGLEKGLRDPAVEVRLAAVRGFEPEFPLIGSRPVSPQTMEQLRRQLKPRIQRLFPMLRDPQRAVRIEAARLLQRVPAQILATELIGPQREVLDKATEDLLESYRVNGDRAGAHMGLAMFYESRAQDKSAIKAYETAMRVEPTATGPRTNLAELFQRLGEQTGYEAQMAMQRGNRGRAQQLAVKADDYVARAQEMRAEELPLLYRDTQLAPNNAAVQHRYGLGLYLSGQGEEAEDYLRRSHELDQENEQYLLMLVLYYKKYQRLDEAAEKLKLLRQLNPDHPTYLQVEQDLYKPCE